MPQSPVLQARVCQFFSGVAMWADGREDTITEAELLLCQCRACTPKFSSHFVPPDAGIRIGHGYPVRLLLRLITGSEKRLKFIFRQPRSMPTKPRIAGES